MSVLLFMDTDRADRAKKAKELNSIFSTVMDQGHTLLGADRATLFMLDDEKKELWSRVGTGIEGIIKIPADQGIVGHCFTTGKSVYVADAYKDPHFNQEVDKKTGFHTGSVLVVPIVADDGDNILGVIQMINKRNPDGSIGQFTKKDEDIIKVLANHVAAFIRVVGS
jgi:phosphoserine phosphatase RsbU/P